MAIRTQSKPISIRKKRNTIPFLQDKYDANNEDYALNNALEKINRVLNQLWNRLNELESEIDSIKDIVNTDSGVTLKKVLEDINALS